MQDSASYRWSHKWGPVPVCLSSAGWHAAIMVCTCDSPVTLASNQWVQTVSPVLDGIRTGHLWSLPLVAQPSALVPLSTDDDLRGFHSGGTQGSCPVPYPSIASPQDPVQPNLTLCHAVPLPQFSPTASALPKHSHHESLDAPKLDSNRSQCMMSRGTPCYTAAAPLRGCTQALTFHYNIHPAAGCPVDRCPTCPCGLCRLN